MPKTNIGNKFLVHDFRRHVKQLTIKSYHYLLNIDIRLGTCLYVKEPSNLLQDFICLLSCHFSILLQIQSRPYQEEHYLLMGILLDLCVPFLYSLETLLIVNSKT